MQLSLRLLRLALILAVAGLLGATAISFLGRFHWLPELLTHFRVQLVVVSAALAVAAAIVRVRPAAAVAALCVLAHASPLAPYLLPRSAPAPLAALPVRILLLNVLTVNDRFDAVAALVWREDPDVVGLLEIDDRWSRALAPLRARYPYHVEHPQQDNFGIALFSRIPLGNVALRRLEHDAVRIAVGELDVAGRRTVLLLAHPVPPAGGGPARLRDRQLDALARIRNEFEGREAIVIGDLNTSPWSPRHARLETLAHLANAARGLGTFPSWPTALPWLMIPIDHCLLSPGLRAASLRLGPPVGSDHLPLIVEVAASPARLAAHGRRRRVPGAGFEPARPFGQAILSRPRLPVSPPGHVRED
jgi:endonuclease/exonuclease/phosphatase (EEP) superfamily protein YafD